MAPSRRRGKRDRAPRLMPRSQGARMRPARRLRVQTNRLEPWKDLSGERRRGRGRGQDAALAQHQAQCVLRELVRPAKPPHPRGVEGIPAAGGARPRGRLPLLPSTSSTRTPRRSGTRWTREVCLFWRSIVNKTDTPQMRASLRLRTQGHTQH